MILGTRVGFEVAFAVFQIWIYSFLLDADPDRILYFSLLYLKNPIFFLFEKRNKIDFMNL
jgi:hypothetical protein